MCRYRTCPDCRLVFGYPVDTTSIPPDVSQLIHDAGIAWTSIFGPGLYAHKKWRVVGWRLQEQGRYDDLLAMCKQWQHESPYPQKWDVVINTIKRYLDSV